MRELLLLLGLIIFLFGLADIAIQAMTHQSKNDKTDAIDGDS